MTIPSEILAIIDRLNQELTQIEQEAARGLNLTRTALSQFPENPRLAQFFTYLNNVSSLVETYKREIQIMAEEISPADVPANLIQDAGEDLGTLLGVTLEIKLQLSQVIARLENLS
jgi:hypothetical protein